MKPVSRRLAILSPLLTTLAPGAALAQATLDPGPTALPPVVVDAPAPRVRPPAQPARQAARSRPRGQARVVQPARAPAAGSAAVQRAVPAAPRPDQVSVAASKRPQELGKVDAAVSVVDGATIRDRQIETTADLQKVLPGLVVDNRGSSPYANFTVRGINSFDYYNPSIQVLVDGVPQSTPALVQMLSNVGRVEFLRGPQGTLFGINAFAGVLSITTEKPRENRVNVGAIASNRLFEIGANTTSVLVPDTLFLDLGIKQGWDLGALKDVARNKDDIDGRSALSGRAALRYAPLGGDFDAMLSASHETLRSREENFVRDQDLHRRWYRSNVLGYYNFLDRQTSTAALAWNYRMGDFTLSNITSFQYVDLARRLFERQFPETTRQIYEELRLSYNGPGPLKGVAGLAFVSNEFTRGQPGFPGFFAGSNNRVESNSAAAFAEGTYSLTSRLDLTAGIRVAYDWSHVNFRQPDIYGNGLGLNFKNDANFSSAQPKVSLGYQVDETTRIYALVSEGYKPGGFNRAVQTIQDSVAYKPETAWNFEIGGRTELFGGRLALSTALYHIRSQDQQVYVGPVGFQILRNAGQGVSTGVEIEARLQATDNLLLTAQGAFGRSEFDKYTDPLTSVNYSGKRIPYAPDAVANLGARYVIDQTLIPARVTLTGNMRITSRTYFDIANTLSQGGFATYDAGLEFAFPNNVTAKIFANNLTDKTYRTYSFAFGGETLSSIGMGRVVGLDIRTRF